MNRELNCSRGALVMVGVAAIAVAIWGWRRLIDNSLERLSYRSEDRGEVIFRNSPVASQP